MRRPPQALQVHAHPRVRDPKRTGVHAVHRHVLERVHAHRGPTFGALDVQQPQAHALHTVLLEDSAGLLQGAGHGGPLLRQGRMSARLLPRAKLSMDLASSVLAVFSSVDSASSNVRFSRNRTL